ncbi:uncharacterized protein ACA1_068250 [Acanthamoeba castellanii str. Neff]|uniref:Transmembrane protein n=1 Tax=Acanthamoeba castellanii (strain ATCC 30010 / Neff) TaxID=1257118 RepID=L8HFN5_ACACF|nr:uncharacterized protein ACA1_068250 [Acanthamoeba castellanii str. Neff]ELR23241.1 hypothetical protein ACA1_068250 [Acanthamoeba castellanii str. Neff]
MLLDDGQSGVGSDARTFFRSQPRANYAGDDVPTDFCAWDSAKRECDIVNYAESISLLALPAACVGIFLIIAFTIAFIVIHTLRCATSCRLCWAERRCETIVLNTCLGVSCFFMFCLMVLPLLGNTWSHEGLLLYMDNQVAFMRDIAKVTNDSAVVLQSIGVAMADTAEQVSRAASTVNGYKNTVYDYETGTVVAFYCLFGILASFCLVLPVLMLCKINCPTSVLVFWVGMVMLLLAYMVMLIAISAGAVGADVCQLYAETKNGNVAPAFERLLDRLGQNCTTFTDAYPQLETAVTETYFCGDALCPTGTCTGSCAGNATCQCFRNVTSIKECGSTCLSPALRTEMIENAILYNTTLKRMTPYLGCTLWTTYSQRTESHLCNGFMYVALFFLIHLSMAGMFLIFIGLTAWGIPWTVMMGALILIGDQTRIRFDDVRDVEMMERNEKRMSTHDRAATIKANTTLAW